MIYVLSSVLRIQKFTTIWLEYKTEKVKFLTKFLQVFMAKCVQPTKLLKKAYKTRPSKPWNRPNSSYLLSKFYFV